MVHAFLMEKEEMRRRIALKEALEIWRGTASSGKDLGKHVSSSDLFELLVGRSSDDIKSLLLRHISLCPQCLANFKDMVEAIEDSVPLDIALPKAAASDEMTWPKEIPTDGKKYTIILRRSITERNRGVVTLQINPAYRDALEGQVAVLRDGTGRILLRGTIINGEVSQQIEDMEKIDHRFLVESN
jgi:hypothetical protein